ncbi:MAG: hypothetical protein KAT04_14475 [Methylococcales bacterium]|nr:hypothetical protein [Methylococcales bacterium]
MSRERPEIENKSGNYNYYFIDYLNGKKALPDTLFIGNDCHRNHGKNNKTIRRKGNKICIKCDSRNKSKRRVQTCIKENGDLSAKHKYEEIQAARELEELIHDDLF